MSKALFNVENCRRYAYLRYSFEALVIVIAAWLTLPPRRNHVIDQKARTQLKTFQQTELL
ncbi:uncharacterized protein METZ01_LOCUS479285 [marine metagenome]|uniref:Uncharacterized protein n=1 Tax=marine metagenome TaxID=408172 RepID=A0A383C2N2_9ZZZZ